MHLPGLPDLLISDLFRREMIILRRLADGTHVEFLCTHLHPLRLQGLDKAFSEDRHRTFLLVEKFILTVAI